MTGVGGGLRLGFLLGNPSLFPHKIRVRTRQGKHAKGPKYQTTQQTRASQPLRSSGASSGWFLLAPLRQHLVLRFLEAPRSRCHALTVNRPRLNTLTASYTEILAACPFSTSQIILLNELDASHPFSIFSALFPQNRNRMHRLRLAPGHLEHLL